MSPPSSNLRGIAAMVFATGSFVASDSFMKLVTEGMPPFEVLFLRGVAATLCCGPLLLVLGQWRALAGIANPIVLVRGGFETACVLCYIVALANMPIADVIAIGQTAPLLLILLVAVIWREPVGPLRIVLVALGFVGALLVAQPDASGISFTSVLAFATAVGIALRDVVSRIVPASIPVLIVTFSTILIVMAASAIMMVALEDPVMPTPRQALYLLGAGFFVTLGHFGIFLAYRLGAPEAVAPFFYSFAVWAVVSGLVVFGEMPNPVALAGIATIVASGLGIVLMDRRRALNVAAMVDET
jgi:drug/metabolite transporter (DMT)-like permease